MSFLHGMKYLALMGFLLFPASLYYAQVTVPPGESAIGKEGENSQIESQAQKEESQKKETKEEMSQGEGNEDNKIFDLGEVEVIGKKQKKNPNKTETRVTREEIRQFNAHDLTSALVLLPSIARKTIGARNEPTISMRGFDMKGVPVFVDGIPVYTPYDGYPDLSRFFVFDIAEIAVSKSFASVLYGPNTIGGAVNIITAKPERPFTAEVEAGYETMDQYHSFASLSGMIQSFYFNAGASYVDRKTFPLPKDFENKNDPTEDKYRNNAAQKNQKYTFRTGYSPDKNQDYALTYMYMHDVKGNPVYVGDNPSASVFYQKWDYYIKQSIYSNTFNQFSKEYYLKTRFYFDQYKNQLSRYDDATYSTMNSNKSFRSIYDDFSYGGSLENGWEFSASHILRSALHYKSDNHSSHNAGEEIVRFQDYIVSVGLEDTYYFIPEKLYTITGFSVDYTKTLRAEELVSDVPTSFANLSENIAYNPQIGLFYKLFPQDTLFLTISQKNRLPTLKDRYSYKSGRGLPNPDLKPESAIQSELGWTKEASRIKSTLTVFYADIDDLITTTLVPKPTNPSQTLMQSQNIAKVRSYGAEAEVQGKILPNILDAGLRYQFVERVDVETTSLSDNPMAGIAKHTMFAFVKVNILPVLSWVTDMEYNDKRLSEDKDHNPYYTSSFVIANTKLTWDILPSLSSSVFIKNLGDKLYEIDEGYPMPGRTYGITMNYSFE